MIPSMILVAVLAAILMGLIAHYGAKSSHATKSAPATTVAGAATVQAPKTTVPRQTTVTPATLLWGYTKVAMKVMGAVIFVVAVIMIVSWIFGTDPYGLPNTLADRIETLATTDTFWFLIAFSLIVIAMTLPKGRRSPIVAVAIILILAWGLIGYGLGLNQWFAGSRACFNTGVCTSDTARTTVGEIELPDTLNKMTAVRLADTWRDVTILPGTCLEADPIHLVEKRATGSRGRAEVKSKTGNEVTVFFTRKRVYTCG